MVEKQRKAKESEDLMSDVKSQLSGDFFGEESTIEHSLRMRELEKEQQSAIPEPKEVERSKEVEERRKAKEALDRAREHVQRLKNRYDKD